MPISSKRESVILLANRQIVERTEACLVIQTLTGKPTNHRALSTPSKGIKHLDTSDLFTVKQYF